MTDADLAPIWKELGRQQGITEGHDTLHKQTHQDIKDIRGDIHQLQRDVNEGMKQQNATMLSCFAEQDKRITAAVQAAIEAAINAHLAGPKPNPVTRATEWANNNKGPAAVIGLLTALVLYAAGRGDLIPVLAFGG